MKTNTDRADHGSKDNRDTRITHQQRQVARREERLKRKAGK
jgi:hypothetical protein